MSEQKKQYKVHKIHAEGTIHPRSVKGNFRRFKTIVMAFAYAVFFLLPWIRWERPVGSHQAVHFDLVTKKFYVFDLVVHAQDIFWLSALLFFAAVMLFFMTALLGRVFCGYFCFQTLWTDAFRLIEKTIQGDRVARIRLDKQPWNGEKILKKGGTHFLWLFMAFWTGLSFTLYWADAPTLFKDFIIGEAPSAAYMTTLILMITTYLAAGWVKENVCMHICPYARFQSVMYDVDTMITSYDYTRGEGTAGRATPVRELKDRKTRQEKGVGDCVDCGMCVQVCPTGIDIRHGAQLACINCGLCIDACNNIMDKYGWERGLIRFASENELEGGKTHFFKLRTYGYGVAMVASIIFLAWSMSSSEIYEATARHERTPLYVALSDGSIQNSYELKINNKSMQGDVEFDLKVEGLDDLKMSTGSIEKIRIAPDDTMRLYVKLTRKPDSKDSVKNHEINFVLTPIEGESEDPIIIKSHYIVP
jgi:cytochrome c oxidase accessory protein FixG